MALVGLSALAIDVSRVYSLQRLERSAADAAALAGAQDLKGPSSRTVGATEQSNARLRALQNLASRLQPPGQAFPSCATGSDIVNCPIPGTPFVVSIKTPSPSWVNVDRNRAIQVTVRQADVELGFAQLFGQNHWDIAETSVAGLDFSGEYAITILRPPANADRTGNADDVVTNGSGAGVVASGGDIGINAGADLSGNSTAPGCLNPVGLTVDSGYYVRYYGATTDCSTPSGIDALRQMTSLIPDPKYQPPPRPPSAWPNNAAGKLSNPDCALELDKASAAGYPSLPAVDDTDCYQPGIYPQELTISNKGAALLKPGVYFFDRGIRNSGILLGGYVPDVAGVAVVIPQGQPFSMRASSVYLAINRGSAYANLVTGHEALAAWSSNTTPPFMLSLIVTGNPACTVTVPANPACTSETIDFTSGAVVSIAGSTYAPSDNARIQGNSDPKGYLGSLLLWTLRLSGNSTINQHYSGVPTKSGFVRLDAACSGGNSICNP